MGVERFRCHLQFPDFLFAYFFFTTKCFVASSDLKAPNKVWLGSQRSKGGGSGTLYRRVIFENHF
jgi:hypothetical protein